MAASRSTLPLIKYLRVRVDALPRNSPLTLAPTVFLRRFCEEVRGSFLDKSEVADRVISCVKNFQKVDPAKVLLSISIYYRFPLMPNFLILLYFQLLPTLHICHVTFFFMLVTINLSKVAISPATSMMLFDCFVTVTVTDCIARICLI